MIYGIKSESESTSVGLKDMSPSGKVHAFEIIKIFVIPYSILIAALLIVALVPLIMLAVAPSGLRTMAVLLLVLEGLVFLIALLVVGFSVLLGTMIIVLEDAGWKEAFRKGSRIFRNYFWEVATMWLINCVLGVTVGVASCIVAVPLLLVILAAVIGVAAVPWSAVVTAPLIFLAILIVITAIALIKSITVVFTTATWVLLYKQVAVKEVQIGS
ncbi:hypothetical protein HY419_01465 [candidate division WWE3 bacterium]|nr:hypothetical protein [candidate division WWE3 bacterium]